MLHSRRHGLGLRRMARRRLVSSSSGEMGTQKSLAQVDNGIAEKCLAGRGYMKAAPRLNLRRQLSTFS